MENSIEMDDWGGVPYFFGNIHLDETILEKINLKYSKNTDLATRWVYTIFIYKWSEIYPLNG